MLSSDLSFVIQGPVYKEFKTNSLIKEINQNFPESKVILSTWIGEDTSNLKGKITEIIKSADPGGLVAMDASLSPNNVNRQIVSTLEGLKMVTTPYSIKLRSDMTILNSSIIERLSRLPKKSKITKFDLTSEYVLVSDVTSINPYINMVLPHHPGDWIYAGKTSDLLNIWSIPLMPDEWFRYFENNPWPHSGWHETNYLSRYRAESYIWWQFLKKYLNFEFENCFDAENGNLELSQNIFGSNLVVLGMSQLGVDSRKHRIGNLTLRPCYTYLESARLIKKSGRDINIEFKDLIHHAWIKLLRICSPFIEPARKIYFQILETTPSSIKQIIKRLNLIS